MPLKLEHAIAPTAMVVITVVLAAVVTGCGDSGASSSSGSNETDRGFVDDMIPHHRSAISLATTAFQHARNPEIRALAKDSITAQRREITALADLKGRFAKEGADGHSTLALDRGAMAMGMNNTDRRTNESV